MKNIYILGAGGSIGTQTLEILKNNSDFNVVGLSLSSKDHINHEILKHFNPEIASLRSDLNLKEYQEKYPNTKWVYGDKGLLQVASYPKKGLLVNALSGSSGLKPTIAAIESGKDIGLANKETLVMAGSHIMNLAKKNNVNLLPIDSEHHAIFELMEGRSYDEIDKIYITASGGALRDLSRRELDDITKEVALNHPNWKMGPKITIDSATMVNKCLEIIEAHHLFNVSYHQIETLLHKESVIHAMVLLKSGKLLINKGPSDMKIPIKKVLYYPKKIEDEPFSYKNITIKPMDLIRFPLVSFCYNIASIGGILPIVFNAANEAAVNLFLKDEISFREIESIILKETLIRDNKFDLSIDEIIKLDKEVKESIYKKYLK